MSEQTSDPKMPVLTLMRTRAIPVPDAECQSLREEVIAAFRARLGDALCLDAMQRIHLAFDESQLADEVLGELGFVQEAVDLVLTGETVVLRYFESNDAMSGSWCLALARVAEGGRFQLLGESKFHRNAYTYPSPSVFVRHVDA